MFNNLGFWAAGAGVQTFDYDLIATGYGSGTATDITFTSIPQAYKWLQIRYVAKSSSTATTLQIRLNGSTATSYNFFQNHSLGTSVTTTSATADTAFNMSYGIAPSTVSGIFSGGVIDLQDYADAKTKQFRVYAGYFSDSTTRALTYAAGLFNDSSSISSISINTGGTQTLNTLSRFSLYGVKG